VIFRLPAIADDPTKMNKSGLNSVLHKQIMFVCVF